MGQFDGKRILVTGASRGIGQQIAQDFASEGARVAVNYVHSRGEAEQVVADIVAAGGDAFAVGADIGQGDQVAAMFEDITTRFGGIDILVNNAGINRDGAFTDMSEEHWDEVIATNLKGPFLCCQAAARLMQSEGLDGGRIVNISAVTSVAGRALAANYSASKGGLNALTRALAVELGPKITVNAIILGFVDSPLVRQVFSPEQIAAVEEKIPSGRLGTFGEVSALVRYLASDDAGFVTGQELTLDGGQLMRMS